MGRHFGSSDHGFCVRIVIEKYRTAPRPEVTNCSKATFDGMTQKDRNIGRSMLFARKVASDWCDSDCSRSASSCWSEGPSGRKEGT